MTAPTKQRLSVAILARDVAVPLRLTLASIRDIADEIVVLETGSTDETAAVAAEFGARVVPFAWCDDFSAARNAAAASATGNWLLWLDAGETISDQMASDLKAFVLDQADPRHAYLLAVRLPAPDASASPEQIARPRLLPRNPAIQFVGRVWESPVASLEQAGIELIGLPFVIRRSERDLEPRLKKQRAQRNLRLAEREIQLRGNSPRLWCCIGDALINLGENARAQQAFRNALALAERRSVAALEAYYGLLTTLGATEQEQELQLTECIQALEIYPVDAQLLSALGGYLQARGKLELASQAYLTAYRFGQVTPTVWHLSDIRDIAAVCHGVTLQLRGKQEEAIRFLEECAGERPESTRIRRRLIDIFIQQGEREPALAHAAALPASTPHLEAFRSAVRGACFAVQKNLIAAKAYLNAAYEHGCRDPLCLKWLAVCLLATGDVPRAKQMLEEWRVLEPRNPEVEKLLRQVPAPAAATTPGSVLRIDAADGGTTRPAAPITLNLPTWSAPK